MKNRILAAVALALTSGGTGALTIEGLPVLAKVAAVAANALGMGLAFITKGPGSRKPKRLELPND